MSVKTIFKVIIGTMALMCISSGVIEVFNINVSAMQVRQTCSIAAKQAADLFTQETYKQGSSADGSSTMATNMPDIVDLDGNTYISGDFYDGKTSVEEIWSDLYGSSGSGNEDFRQVLICGGSGDSYIAAIDIPGLTGNLEYNITIDDAVKTDSYILDTGDTSKCLKNVFKEVGQIYAGIFDSSRIGSVNSHEVTYEEFSSDADIVKQKSFAKNAEDMVEQYYTPVNVGVPYFDPTVINKMFQYNLAALLCSGKSDLIHTKSDEIFGDEFENATTYDTSGDEQYINYRGFRCYVQDAYISKLTYYVYDKDSNSSEINSLINLDTANLMEIAESESNNYITIVGIEYRIPVTYQGITPIKALFNWLWRREVNGDRVKDMKGIDGFTDGDNDTLALLPDTNAEVSPDGEWRDVSVNNDGYMDNTVADGANGMYDYTNEIYYVLTR